MPLPELAETVSQMVSDKIGVQKKDASGGKSGKASLKDYYVGGVDLNVGRAPLIVPIQLGDDTLKEWIAGTGVRVVGLPSWTYSSLLTISSFVCCFLCVCGVKVGGDRHNL